jgi:hypothetical protein
MMSTETASGELLFADADDLITGLLLAGVGFLGRAITAFVGGSSLICFLAKLHHTLTNQDRLVAAGEQVD